jgi:sulfate adenylyltransferase subunit 1 (EFTu-like GTPase family)
LRVGDEIVVLPSGEITRIHSLEEYGKHPQKAESGKVIGLTIDDKLFVNRGYVLARRTDLPIITDVIEASIFWMDRLAGKQDEMYTLRCATQEVPCKIESIHKTINTSTLEINDYDPAEIKYREVAEVILRTGRPIVVDEFNKVRELARFVLARENPVAGGRVEKANPSSSSRVIL